MHLQSSPQGWLTFWQDKIDEACLQEWFLHCRGACRWDHMAPIHDGVRRHELRVSPSSPECEAGRDG